MNSTAESRWSDADLHRYLDDELSRDERAALTTALFGDETLRARLDRWRALDALGREALLGDGCVRASTSVRRRIVMGAGAIAAGLALVGAATVVWSSFAPTGDPAEVEVAADAGVPALETADRRVILTLPVRSGAGSSVVTAETPSAPESDSSLVEDALTEGRIDDALRLLAQSNVASRSSEWAALGRLMQSAERTRAAILFLPIDQQIEIVRVWAQEPSLRPVVFERLEELLRDPESASAARRLRAELAQSPHLKSWVSSYAATP